VNLQKKLGPLALWQWIAIGAAVGGAIVLWRRAHPGAASDAAATATPSDAEFNPIDPTTGLPISGGISSGAATDTGAAGAGGSLTDLLSNFGALESLLSGLQEISPGPAVETDPDTVAAQTGSKKSAAAKKAGSSLSPLARAKKALTSGKLGPINRQRLKAAGYTDAQISYHLKHKTPLGAPYAQQHPTKKTKPAKKNPGHTTTSHGNGKKTASSSAPHNPRQHVNVQSPAHQRHPPTKHPSAQHPAARKPAPKKKAKARR
jgi:hypothetical protein